MNEQEMMEQVVREVKAAIESAKAWKSYTGEAPPPGCVQAAYETEHGGWKILVVHSRHRDGLVTQSSFAGVAAKIGEAVVRIPDSVAEQAFKRAESMQTLN